MSLLTAVSNRLGGLLAEDSSFFKRAKQKFKFIQISTEKVKEKTKSPPKTKDVPGTPKPTKETAEQRTKQEKHTTPTKRSKKT